MTIKDEGYEKKERRRRNKRCIPKEGMPHAQKACQKKVEKKERKMHTQRRYATCPQGMSKKKKRKEKDSPHPWKIKKSEGLCKGVHPPSTKNSHTLAHLDQIV